MTRRSAGTTRRLLTSAFVLLLLCTATACTQGQSRGEPPKSGEEQRTSAGSTSPSASPAGAATYEAQVRLHDVCSLGHVLMNGFPVDSWGGRGVNQSYDVQVNTALMREGNRLSVENQPCLSRSGQRLSMGTIKMQAWVESEAGKPVAGTRITEGQVDSAYAAWQRRARAAWQGYLQREGPEETWALDSLRAWAEAHPLVVSTGPFSTSGEAPDFSSVFGAEAPRIEGTAADSARLTGYAMRLKRLMVAKDTAALFEAFKPALQAKCSMLSQEQVEDCVASNRSQLVLSNAAKALAFTRADVGLRKWSGGRVWELYRKPNDALLRRVKVYVGKQENKLQVVRCCS